MASVNIYTCARVNKQGIWLYTPPFLGESAYDETVLHTGNRLMDSFSDNGKDSTFAH